MLTALVSATACTTEASPPVSTAQLTTTIVVQEPTTTAASTTATTATTAPESTAPPTSSQAEIEAELIRVLDGGNEVFYLNPPDPESPLLDRYYTPEEAALLRRAFEQDLEDGVHLEGEFIRVFVDSVEVDGDSAVVVECGIDAFIAIGPEGEVLTEVDQVALLRNYELERAADGNWRIKNTTFGPERTECGD